MACKGATVAGTDGDDYSHRETIGQQYHVSANTKSKLKWIILCHYLLSGIMALKLLPDVLDRLDIFVMELEQLYVPKPDLWEWTWLASSIGATVAWSSCKRSRVYQMRLSQVILLLFGFGSVFIGMATHSFEAYGYVAGDKRGKLSVWMGYPVSLLWYAFLSVAFQIHAIELHFTKTLVGAWQPKRKAN